MTDVTQQRKFFNCNGLLLFLSIFSLYNDFDMTLNHCLFLVHIDISIISVSLHLRIKQAQPTIILRSDLCVISKLQLNKNDLKRRVKRETDRPKRLYKILLENRSSHAIYPIPLFSDSLSTPLLAVGLRKILFDYCLALFQ